MKWPQTPVDAGPPLVRHVIRGARLADVPVSGIEVLMHRYVKLKEWRLRDAADVYWRCYWPISAGGEIVFNGKTQPLHPGQLYLVTPHTAFDSHCVRPFAKWYIHFTVTGLNEQYEPGVTSIRPTARMRALLADTCPATNSAKWQHGAAARPLTTIELIVLVLRRAFEEKKAIAPANERLSRCIAFMRERLVEKLTLKSIARFAGTSQRTLSQAFVVETGFSPIHYLIELRLNHAMQLLRHTNHSIEQIAEECGFANRYYFTRMLAKYRHITPATFRRYREHPVGRREGSSP